MKRTKRNITIFIASIACIAIFTFLSTFIPYISSSILQNIAKICVNLLNGMTAVTAMRLSGMHLEIDLKNGRQYLTGLMIALILGAVIAVIPALCGYPLVGGHIDFSIGYTVYKFLYFMLIIGPVEELIFRVYFQDVCMSFFNQKKWAGVVLSALLFGFYHIFNGNIFQVIFAFGIGLVFGFCKYKIKNCGYVGVAFGHGLYDFFCTLTTMFLV